MRLLVLFVLIFASSCGKLKPSQSLSQSAFSLSRSTAPALKGHYRSDCALWVSEGFSAFAISNYYFGEKQVYDHNTSFYLDSSCQVPLGQMLAQGSVNFDQENSLIELSNHSAKFRVFTEELAVQYRGAQFCGANDWQDKSFKFITDSCELGRGQLLKIQVSADQSRIELNSCLSAQALGCPIRTLIRI